MPLNEKGFEMPDIRSLVAVVDLRPITMGERVQRYMRTPALRDDLVYHNDEFDPEDFYDDEDRPMSPHEDRYGHYMERQKQRKTESDARRKAAAEEQAKADAEEFQRKVRAVKADVPRTE